MKDYTIKKPFCDIKNAIASFTNAFKFLAKKSLNLKSILRGIKTL